MFELDVRTLDSETPKLDVRTLDRKLRNSMFEPWVQKLPNSMFEPWFGNFRTRCSGFGTNSTAPELNVRILGLETSKLNVFELWVELGFPVFEFRVQPQLWMLYSPPFMFEPRVRKHCTHTRLCMRAKLSGRRRLAGFRKLFDGRFWLAATVFAWIPIWNPPYKKTRIISAAADFSVAGNSWVHSGRKERMRPPLTRYLRGSERLEGEWVELFRVSCLKL